MVCGLVLALAIRAPWTTCCGSRPGCPNRFLLQPRFTRPVVPAMVGPGCRSGRRHRESTHTAVGRPVDRCHQHGCWPPWPLARSFSATGGSGDAMPGHSIRVREARRDHPAPLGASARGDRQHPRLRCAGSPDEVGAADRPTLAAGSDPPRSDQSPAALPARPRGGERRVARRGRGSLPPSAGRRPALGPGALRHGRVAAARRRGRRPPAGTRPLSRSSPENPRSSERSTRLVGSSDNSPNSRVPGPDRPGHSLTLKRSDQLIRSITTCRRGTALRPPAPSSCST